MKILIDIGHPAHIHYFKNFIFKSIKDGNEIKIVARDKEVTIDLLKSYKLSYVSRGKGGNSFFKKLIYFPYAIFKFLFESIKFKPDYFLAFGSPYLPLTSFLYQIPLITCDDTEHDFISHYMYKPFSSLIITPAYFRKNLGNKHVRINSIFELGSLHPMFFTPDTNYLDNLNPDAEKYAIIRFVEWNAIHDLNENGFSLKSKQKIVDELSNHMKVYISSEGKLPKSLEKFRIKTPPDRIHDFMSCAEIFIGDSGTMTVEAALLGTPAIMFSSSAKHQGNFISLTRDYSLLIICEDQNDLLNLALNVIKNKNSKALWKKRSKKFMDNSINFTEFLLWLFEDYNNNSKKLIKDKYINDN